MVTEFLEGVSLLFRSVGMVFQLRFENCEMVM